MEREVYREMYERQETFWWHRGMRRIFDIFLKKYVGTTHNNILDIGCGTGALFPVLRHYGTVYGIDIASDAVEYARKQGNAHEVVQGSAEDLPYASAIFDVVVCSDLLYHVQVRDDMKVLAEIYRVLKSGGTLIVKEASYDWLRSRMDELVHTKHRFTGSELTKKLMSAQFHIIRITYAMTLLFPLALVARLVERVLPQSYGASGIFESGRTINWLFTRIVYREASMLTRCNFPFGLSVIAVAKKI